MTSQQLYLSTVLNKQVTDASGQLLGRLWDLTVTPDEKFPAMGQLLFRRHGETYSVAWDRVVLFNSAAISVSLSHDELAGYRETGGEIRVKRDILDRQVIDVRQARLARVNDLGLARHKDALCLRSIDVGFRGLLRRMGLERLWGRFRKEIPGREIGWEMVWHLEAHAARLTAAMARKQIGEMRPADLARIVSRIPRQSIQPILDSLDGETACKAIYQLEPKPRSRVIGALDSERASELLHRCHPL
jgi:sporulation protein YlmC with PRC-barrel domain